MAAALVFTSCSNDSNFSNKGYIAGGDKVQNLFIKPSANSEVRTLEVAIAMPEQQELNFEFVPNQAAVNTFNQSYGEKAIFLESDFYTITDANVSIKPGAVLSSVATIAFQNITQLDREQVYVLPVTVKSPNLALLKSAETTFYVFKGAALINVVADIEKNFLQPTWKNASVANNLSEVTLEALVRIRDFNNGEISTVMGIEGYFLIRLGDANFERNQIQLATNNGNFPDRDSSKGLPTNQWVHIAVTYNSANNELIIYVDGKEQSKGSKRLGTISLGTSSFYIGKSYNNDRWLAGDISECRIWNKVRTAEEIKANPYSVEPTSEGLVSYWKFDEGLGNIVKDHTENGNDLGSYKDLPWKAVTLPEPAK